MEREKITKSGRLLEVDIYGVTEDGRALPRRAPKSRPSTAEQEKYNHLCAAKRAVRLVNANFDERDYYMHPTYKPADAPQTDAEAKRDMHNFLRRYRALRERELARVTRELAEMRRVSASVPDSAAVASAVKMLDKQRRELERPFRYIYHLEQETYKSGRYAGRANWHFHLFLTGGIPARDVEKLWAAGVRVNCNNYQPGTFGPEAASRYMCKQTSHKTRLVTSRNIIRPTERTRDGKLTRRTVERMAKERTDDRAFWERRHKGYKFLRCYPRYNAYNGRWYLTVVMWRTDGAPPRWDADDWNTTAGP